MCFFGKRDKWWKKWPSVTNHLHFVVIHRIRRKRIWWRFQRHGRMACLFTGRYHAHCSKSVGISHTLTYIEHMLTTFWIKKPIIWRKKIKMPSMDLKITKKTFVKCWKYPCIHVLFFLDSEAKDLFLLYFEKQKHINTLGQQL
jgi:hypothetical protein